MDEHSEGLSDILSVIQVCIEGMVTRESVKQSQDHELADLQELE